MPAVKVLAETIEGGPNLDARLFLCFARFPRERHGLAAAVAGLAAIRNAEPPSDLGWLRGGRAGR